MSDFKPFAVGSTSKVLPISSYINDERNYRTKGLVPDTIARTLIWNRAIRQASLITSAFGIVADTKSIALEDTNNLEDVKDALEELLIAWLDNPVVAGSHNTLVSRDVSNAHPISSITDLTSSLTVGSSSHPLTKPTTGRVSFSQIRDTFAGSTGQNDGVISCLGTKDKIDLEVASKSVSWGNINGDIEDQTDLTGYFVTKNMIIKDTTLTDFMYASDQASAATLSGSYPTALVIFPPAAQP